MQKPREGGGTSHVPPSGVELGLVASSSDRCEASRLCDLEQGPVLSGPQKRLPQSLLVIISAEESLLKRKKSEASGVTWTDVGGVKGGPSLEVGGSDTRYSALAGTPLESVCGRQPEEIMEGRARGLITMLSASQLGTSTL